jgi:McrBC 5-methylcytosine restriction system component
MDNSILENEIITLPCLIPLIEHEGFSSSFIEEIKKLGINFCDTGYECAPKYLGINPETFCASYFIGAEWITDRHAVVVTPKVPNLDFIEMFVCALKFEPVAKYFSKFYSIDFNSKPIKTNVFNNQITPLIVIHFIALLKNITKRGLKKAYVLRNENIKSKIKGKINFSQHIKQNVIQQREDRVYCQYQEYTVNNLENRILKKALIYAESYVNSLYTHKSFETLISTVNSIKTYFTEVSDDVELHELKSIVNNKIYKEYLEAIRIAKMILRKFNYSISETKINMDFTPAFWIDMSRLYEVYVYSKLHARYGDDILFQVPGYGHTAVDFVDKERKIVIDTKYKPQYNYRNGGVIDDVRQISAYARDKKILKVMNCNIFSIVKCLIIYPEDMTDKPKEEDGELFVNLTSLNDFDTFHDKNCNIVNGYEEFYKISIPMPLVN